MNWSLGRRITALSATAAILLGLIAVVGTLAAAQNRTDFDRVLLRVDPARSNAERMLASLYRQQSAVRTYALTGVESDLQTYRDAFADERNTIASTRDLLKDEPPLLVELDKVTTA